MQQSYGYDTFNAFHINPLRIVINKGGSIKSLSGWSYDEFIHVSHDKDSNISVKRLSRMTNFTLPEVDHVLPL